jgi:hypothetical protein
MIFAEFPATGEKCDTSLGSSEPAAMTGPSPMLTPFKRIARLQIHTWSPIAVRFAGPYLPFHLK